MNSQITQTDASPFLFARTKLRPPRLRSDTLPRPRLVETIRQAIANARLVLVSAPAGYGKTTLVANAVSGLTGVPVVWVTLNSEDNEPLRFLHLLTLALQPFVPAFATAALTTLTTASAESNSRLLGRLVMTALVNELFEEERPLCLVLDDLHYVTHEEVHAALNFLVERLPPHVTLLIATRHDPGFALAQLRARRELVELRLEELRFTREEAATLLNQQLGVALSSAELAALMKRTDGWAAGMTLLSASFARLTTPAARTAFIDQLTHNQRYIFDYLAESVLNREDSATRTFLIETAIFDELHPKLCTAVTGRADAEALLHTLFRRNLFVMALETSGATHSVASQSIYRYHDLFRDFLREQLRRQPGEYVRTLHRRAAEAIEERSQGTQQAGPSLAALAYHYEQAQLWDKTRHYAGLAAEQAQQQFAFQRAIEHFTSALTAAQQQQHTTEIAALQRARGLAHLHESNLRAAEHDFGAALTVARATGDRTSEWQLLLDLGNLWAGQDYNKTGEYYQAALRLAEAMNDSQPLAYTLNRVGNWYLNVDQPQQARTLHERALGIFGELGDPLGEAQTLDFLAITAYECSDLLTGIDYYQRAITRWRALDDRRGLITSLTLFAMYAEHANDIQPLQRFDDCFVALDEALRLAREMGWRLAECQVSTVLGLVAGVLGDFGRAMDALHAALTIAQEIEHAEWQLAIYVFSGAVYRDLLATAEQQQCLLQAQALLEVTGTRIWRAWLLEQLAPLYAHNGDLNQALHLLQENAADEATQRSNTRRVDFARAEVDLLRGEPLQALQTCQRLLATAANRTAATVIPRIALVKGQALLALGQFTEAEQTLLAAGKVAQIHGTRPLLWRIHLTLGQVYLAQGRPDQAEIAFAQSRRLIDALAATIAEESMRRHFTEQANTLFPARSQPSAQMTGGFRIPDTGETLTEREIEVLRLIARGADNATIATEMIVSIHTVKTHVAHILGKLAVPSRTAAAIKAKELGLTK